MTQMIEALNQNTKLKHRIELLNQDIELKRRINVNPFTQAHINDIELCEEQTLG